MKAFMRCYKYVFICAILGTVTYVIQRVLFTSLKCDIYWNNFRYGLDYKIIHMNEAEYKQDLLEICERKEKQVKGQVKGQMKPLCPCNWPQGLGPLAINGSDLRESPTFQAIERVHTELSPGGLWRPPNCTSRHKVAVIVPYRDRPHHLQIFISHIHTVLQRQQLDYRIFLVEQTEEPKMFNKAALMNTGFQQAKTTDQYDCFVFHDVDTLIQDDRNIYACSSSPRHVASHVDRYHYEVPYPMIFGACTAFTAEQFERVNGFSNQYYGWGGEDDDMFNRIMAAHMAVVRYPDPIGRFTIVEHKKDVGNPYNKEGCESWLRRPGHYKQDGLSSLKTTVLRVEEKLLYTLVSVKVPEPPTL